MPMLVLLNGPPGIGKSTLARRYVDDHPPVLCLDIDVIRRMLGGWEDHPESGLLARAMAIAAARVQLHAGYDVVIPQYLGRPEFVETLESLAAETGASFHEIVLMDRRPNALKRFDQRAEDPRQRTHHEAAVRMAGGSAGIAELYERLEAMLRGRPRATVVLTSAGDVDEAYARILAVIDGPTTS